ncbi:MAG TPA: hypothetical protein VMW65_02240, partial [Chloroflexota bacterium]|nr:hypothetical protein [Chloroflexota bacterium]
GIPLTNCARGIDSVARGWHPLNELRALYAAPRLPEVHERLILIKINRLYRPDMTDNELYEATRKWWKCAPHRHEPRLALAVYLGVVRAVYRVRGWEKSPNEDGKGPPRYAFHGTHAGDVAAAYEWHNVANLVGQTQNPIKYVNC